MTRESGFRVVEFVSERSRPKLVGVSDGKGGASLDSHWFGGVHEEGRTADGVVSRVRRALEDGESEDLAGSDRHRVEGADALLLARRLRWLEERVPGLKGRVELSASADDLARCGRSDGRESRISMEREKTRDVLRVVGRLDGVPQRRVRPSSCGI